MRKDGSLFSTVVDFINAIPVGSTYKSSELVNATRGVEEVTWWKRINKNEAYRTRTYQTYLSRLGFLQNVKRGEWKVLGHAPEWLDLGVVNFALGYGEWNYETRSRKSQYKGKTRQQWQDMINSCINISKLKFELIEEAEKVNSNKNAPQPGEALATFQCIDIIKACIDLRKIGVLAVPVNAEEIEIHIIHKDCAEDLAIWMHDNGFELEEYPELDNFLGTVWSEMYGNPWWHTLADGLEEDDEDCDCHKVYLTVLNFFESTVNVHKVLSKDIEDFMSEEYGENYEAYTEWMTSEELKLNINC
jgi:hypothetical protein